MRELQLTRGYAALVDESDWDRVSQIKWQALVLRNTVYGVRTVRHEGKQGTQYLHRFLLDAPKGLEVDHIDGNGLNNRRSNLRLGTRAENRRNRQRQRPGPSGYVGVHWNARLGKWCAQIRIDGKRKHLGYFIDPAQAARVRDAAAIELHGEFAWLNFPGGSRV
ncbi:HNH endonuclease [Lentzea sp. E54]|uniref:HNH endonuclease n=1 Tax=Lentzea xerophila TaxID=3435883 RepID=UPI003DA3C5A9